MVNLTCFYFLLHLLCKVSLDFYFLKLGTIFSSPATPTLHPKLVSCTYALLASDIKFSRFWLYKFVLITEKQNSIVDYCHCANSGYVLWLFLFLYNSCPLLGFAFLFSFFTRMPLQTVLYQVFSRVLFLRNLFLRSLFCCCHTWLFRRAGKLLLNIFF